MKKPFSAWAVWLTLVSLSALNSQVSSYGQGSLTPPGAPAPTMKTLAQVEPRTPISSAPYIINDPGSYYLTTNLTTGSFQAGVVILADNVTLDLNGFALIGVPNSFSGIICFGHTNTCVRNGAIRGWANDGIDGFPSSNTRFENLFIVDNTTGGLLAGRNAVVVGCTITGNGGGGISVGDGSRLDHCNAQNNFGSGIATGSACIVSECAAVSNTVFGINVGAGSTVGRCSATGNGTNGIITAQNCSLQGCAATFNSGAGIMTGDGSTLTGCAASGNSKDGSTTGNSCTVKDSTGNNGNLSNGISTRDNCTVEGCNTSGNGLGIVGPSLNGFGIQVGTNSVVTRCSSANNKLGIRADDASTLINCVASGNRSDGIAVQDDCILLRNFCKDNGQPASPNYAGLHVTGINCRVEDNHLIANKFRGLKVDGIRNVIIRNTAKDNVGQDFDIVAGNNYGQILAVPGAGFINSNPWANIAF